MKVLESLNKKNILRKRNKIEAYVQREFASKAIRLSQAYFIITLFNLVVFGYFGLYRGIKLYNEKRNFLELLDSTETNMIKNIETIDIARPYVTDNAGVKRINNAIPDYNSDSEYLRQLVDAFSSSNFGLTRFVSSPGNNSSEIFVNLNGTGSERGLSLLLDSLQTLPRFTRITDIQIQASSTSPGMVNVRINAKIYVLEGVL